MNDPILARRRELWIYLSYLKGNPPTYREMVTDLGYGSVGSTIREDIRFLVQAGYIQHRPGNRKAITVLIPLVTA